MFKNAEDSIAKKNWDWRDNPIKIRSGQTWKKNDSGNIGFITRVLADKVFMQRLGKKKHHHITKKDLLMFWKKI